MKRLSRLSIIIVCAMVLTLGLSAQPAATQGDPLVVYMQMGGTQGDGTTLARTNGARAAAEALGIELHEQYSSWDAVTMINQFTEAMAADPDGIVIMGHPGEDAFAPLVAEAIGRGIIVTSGNNPLPNLEAPPNLRAIGTQHGNITANMVNVLKDAGLEPGDIIVGGIDLSPATIEGIQTGYISVSFDQLLYLQGWYPVMQIWLTANYKIPGLHINTGVGTVTPQNIGELIPLIEQGIR